MSQVKIKVSIFLFLLILCTCRDKSLPDLMNLKCSLTSQLLHIEYWVHIYICCSLHVLHAHRIVMMSNY